MLLDHLYATVLHDHLWLTYVGRIAFPLFAFELVQGYMHTHDLRRYAKRILLLAKETAASRRVLYLLGLVGTVLLPRLLMTDYGAEGVLLILLFWFTRKGGAVNYLIQVVVMFVMWQFVFCGRTLLIGSFVFQTQCFALCALPLIWLYNGKHGTRNKALQYAAYAFYPVHLFILGIIFMRMAAAMGGI